MTMRSPLFVRKGAEDSQYAKKGRDRGRGRREASLTATASAYKDDGFVNYGAHGDGSPLRALHSNARRSRSRPKLTATKTSSFSSFLHLLLACVPRRCTADKHAYTPVRSSV